MWFHVGCVLPVLGELLILSIYIIFIFKIWRGILKKQKKA